MSTWSVKTRRAWSRHCRSMVIRLRPCMAMNTPSPLQLNLPRCLFRSCWPPVLCFLTDRPVADEANLQNEEARIRVDALNTEAHNLQLKETLKRCEDELNSRDRLIEKYQIEIRQRGDEIEKKARKRVYVIYIYQEHAVFDLRYHPSLKIPPQRRKLPRVTKKCRSQNLCNTGWS